MKSNKEQVTFIQDLFPGGSGLYKRMLTYSYLYSVWAHDNPKIDPKHLPLNFIGAPGEGKSATIYDWARSLGLEMVVRTLAGVSDFESIFGIVHINEETGKTRLFTPQNMPLEHEDDRYGIVFIDDFNRGEQQCIPAAMQFVNTGRYNDYTLPKHFGIVAAMNPHG